MDTIRIEGLELRCIVGVRSYERRREQPLRVDVRLGLDLRGAGRSGRITDTADYACVADEVTALLRFREYRLLEVAAEEAAAMLLGVHPAVQEVTLRLDKPQALAGRARSASVEITRAREATASEVRPYGYRRELLRSSEATLELISIEPGHTARLNDPERRLEWLVGGELSELGDPPSAALATTSPTAVYTNRGAGPASVFRCLAREAQERTLAAE
jgi:FolB domain-containing protein